MAAARAVARTRPSSQVRRPLATGPDMTILRLLPVLFLAACATRNAIEESRRFTHLADHNRAFVILDEARQQRIDSGDSVPEELEAAWQDAKVAFLLHRAETRIFQENEGGALADLAEVGSMVPDHPAIAGLRDRAERKRARRMRAEGDGHLSRKDYIAALASFLESEAIEPGHADAQAGIKAVQEATSRLSRRGQEEFLEAVRKLPEFRFVEVQWHSANVMVNTPHREEAKPLQDRARRENAKKAVQQAKQWETAGDYGAALIDYKAAKRLDPELPGIDESIAQMLKEQRAVVLVDKAQMLMNAGRFDEAREALGEAFELSIMARNDIGELSKRVKKLEGERRYQAARDLEVLGKKVEALAAFEALTKDWPEGFEDEVARIGSLRTDIDGAAKSWTEAEAAEAAGDLPKALELYLDSERYYPGWKDGKERIARLRAVIPPPPPPPAPAGTTEGGTQGGTQGSTPGGGGS
jgi:tetratricopeptide (TPR) repeat protein